MDDPRQLAILPSGLDNPFKVWKALEKVLMAYGCATMSCWVGISSRNCWCSVSRKRDVKFGWVVGIRPKNMSPVCRVLGLWLMPKVFRGCGVGLYTLNFVPMVLSLPLGNEG